MIDMINAPLQTSLFILTFLQGDSGIKHLKVKVDVFVFMWPGLDFAQVLHTWKKITYMILLFCFTVVYASLFDCVCFTSFVCFIVGFHTRYCLIMFTSLIEDVHWNVCLWLFQCEVVFNNDRNMTYSCVYVPTMEGEYRVCTVFHVRD